MTISNFFENSRRYSQVKVHHVINDTGGKFATSFANVVDTDDKFATDVNDTGGNLPGINDTSGKFATGVNNTGGAP
jgi:hypothetical protein